jgi:hypothetical protein
MASSGKKKTTMAKLNRERKLRERRVDKQAKKDARKHAPTQQHEQSDDALTSAADDQSGDALTSADEQSDDALTNADDHSIPREPDRPYTAV